MVSRSRPITAGGITFYVRTPWAVVREYVRRLAEAEAVHSDAYARQAAIEDATGWFLAQVVVGWEGVTDEQGQPVAFAHERLGELDATVIAELLEKIAEPPEELVPKKGPNGWP